MKVHFRRGNWIARDLIELIAKVYEVKKDPEIIENNVVRMKKDKLKVIERTMKLLDYDNKYIQFFAEKNIVDGYRDYIAKPLHYTENANGIIKIFEEIDATDFKKALLLDLLETSNEGINLNSENIIGKLNTLEGVSDLLDMMNLDNDTKWMLFEFTKNPQKYIDEFIKALEKFAPQFEKMMEKHIKKLHAHEDEIEERIKADGEDVYREVFEEFHDYSKKDNMYISTTFVDSQGMRVNLIDNDAYVYFGYDMKESLELIRGKSEQENILNIISIISDPLKFQILTCMKDKEVYGKEICDATGLSKAALSYHIGQLTSMGLIKFNKIGNKIYYTAKSDYIEESIEKLKKYF